MIALLLLPLLLFAQPAPRAVEPPVIAVGYDAYRAWDHWYLQRIGERAYMRSTYDRSGGNEGADASHFLYQLADDRNVTLDVEGPGILSFVRTNHWHGSPWHYEMDGRDHVVAESSTADPNHPAPNATFLPASAFTPPLALTWATTKGADLSWVPMPFTRSLRLAYGRTHYGTGYYIYQQFTPGAKLSHPLRPWDETQAPPRDVLDLLTRAGTDIAPKPGTRDGRRAGIRQQSGAVAALGRGETVVWQTTGGPSVVRAVELSAPRDRAVDFGRCRIAMRWDGRPQDSVSAPIALFFGAGTLYNRDGREYLVKSLPVSIRFDSDRVHLACYFPMPFFRSARVALVGLDGAPIPDVRWSMRWQPLREPPRFAAYFHATYRDFPTPEPGRDLDLLDTDTAEGARPSGWSGHLVGMSWVFSHRANLSTLEGDPRFFFDGSQTPQAQGTGTEEWGGGGDYWGGENMTLALVGHPTGARSEREARDPEDRIESAYRFLMADLMPFGNRARICLEHGGTNESREHYEAVTYWYGAPAPILVQTDALHVGDLADERAHDYVSPQASAPYSLSSRYEWGPDTLNGREVYPAATDTGRVTTGQSIFTVHLRPDNLGVLLRRKLDYAYPNQRADVWVADATGTPKWKRAGVWYLAGSNTCVFSNPRDELGAMQHVVETSNRRFRDDEFLLPRALTRGRSAIRVRVAFTPVRRPLYPGAPAAPLGWSEMRYTALCYVLPPPQ